MKTESLHRGWGRFAAAAGALALLLAAPSSAFAANFLDGAVSSFPDHWSVSDSSAPGTVATKSGTGAELTLAFDLGDDQTLTYTAPTASDAGGRADVVISNAVFSAAYEYPGLEEVGGIEAQAAICVHTNGTGGLEYCGWSGGYTVDGVETNLTWFTLIGATPVEGATNTVTMSFDYTVSPATVTFKIGDTELTPKPVALSNNTKTQVSAVSFSGRGSIGELAGETSPNAFAVNFYTNDVANLFWTTNVPAGDVPVFLGTPNPPAKAATAEYTYAFAGWTNAASAGTVVTLANETIVSPTNYYATFAATPVSYTLSWVSDGDELTGTYTSGQVPFGTTIVQPDTPTKTGYSFDEWTPAPVAGTMPAANTTYTATWNPATDTAYTVKHFQQALDGSYPASPTDTDNLTGTTGEQTAAAAKSYTGFTAGAVAQETIAADGTTVVTIQYERNSYQLTWTTDGDALTGNYTSGLVRYGAPITAPNTPTKTGSSFKEWSPAVAATMPAEATTYAATWNVNTFTVYWVVNGTTVETDENVPYGTTPTYNGETPTKDSTATTNYTFTVWSPAVGPIAQDTTYTAQFSESPRPYALAWDGNGGALSGDYTAAGSVANGASITAPTAARDGYAFEGWSPEFTGTMPAADTTYVAQWTEVAAPVLALAEPTLDSTTVAGPAGTTVSATIDPSATVTATNANAAVVVDGTTATATFSNLTWNASVDWMLQSTGAADLPGRFYAKGETQWFSTNELADIDDLAEGMKGVDMSAAPSPTGQMVRIQTRLEIPEGAQTSLPTGEDVGEARTGFAIAQIAENGDEAPAYYAFNGASWDRLFGAAPAEGATNDLLMVLDTVREEAFYYVDGVALYATNAVGDPVYAIGMKASDAAVVKGIGFSNPDGVKAPVVAEYDVPFVAAVSGTPYTDSAAAVAALAAANKAAANDVTVTLLADGVAGSVDLDEGEQVTVAAGAFDPSGLVFTAAGAPTWKPVSSGTAPTLVWTVSPNDFPVVWHDGDGSELGTTSVVYGTVPVYLGATEPSKTATATTNFTFDGWAASADGPKLDPLPAVTGPTNFYAHFSESAREYTLTVTFTAPEGFAAPETYTNRVANGAAYSYTPPNVPGCTADPAVVEGTMPTEDVTVAVAYTAIEYTITWNYKAADGSDTSDTTTVIWGQTPSHADPADYVANNTMHSFLAWDTTPAAYDGTVIAYTATYSSTAAKATVFSVAGNGATTNTVGYYETLAQAVAAATNGCTVLLLDDVTLSSTVSVTNNLTIDLNGNDVAATDCRAIWVKSGDVRITGSGTISAEATASAPEGFGASSVVRVGDGVANASAAALVIDTNVVVSSTACYGVTVFGKNDADGNADTADISLDLYGTVSVTSSGDADAAISGQGRSDYLAADITVHDGAVVSSANSAAIYFPGAGTLTVDGGTVTGKHGIVARAGDVVVNGGTVEATGTGNGEVLGDSNDIVVPYAAISYTTSRPDVWQHYASGDKATVNGGTILSAVAPCVVQIAADGDAAAVLIPADSAAVFSDADAEGVPAGYALKETGAGTGLYEVARTRTVAFTVDGAAYTNLVVFDGEPVAAPVPNPEKTDHSFRAWQTNGVDWVFSTPVAADLTLVADWTQTAFTVTWKNGDTVLETDEHVALDAQPSYGGDEPTQEPVGVTTYTFDGWTGGDVASPTAEADLPLVTADVVYTAHFAASGKPVMVISVAGTATNYWDTLAQAVFEAQTGDTVVLLTDAELSSTVEITKSLTIDLNGNDLAATDCRALWIKSGDVRITGSGTVSAEASASAPEGFGASSVIRVGDGTANLAAAALLIDTNVVVSSAACYGVTVFGKNNADGDPATADISLDLYGTVSVTSSGDADAAISGQGRSDFLAADITVHDGAVVSSANSAAIYFPGAGTLTVDGGTVTGKHGIVARAGDVVVNGGTVEATGTGDGEVLGDSNDIVVPYAAISYTTSRPDVWQHYASGDKATVNGGTILSAVAPCVVQIAADGDAAAVLIPADSEAVFSDADADGVPDGYALKETAEGSGLYSIAKTWAVAFTVDGAAYTNLVVFDGEPVERPADPRKDCYTFRAWQTNGVDWVFTDAVTTDLALVANWTRNAVTVTAPAVANATASATTNGVAVAGAADGNGATLFVVEAGTPVVVTYAADAGYHVSGSDPVSTTADVQVAAADTANDLTLAAGLLPTMDPNVYDVVWENWDETPLATNRVVHGTTTNWVGDTPARASTDDFGYVFASWTTNGVDVAPDAVAIVADTVFAARFDAVSLAEAKWIGGAQGDWNVETNWDIGYVPTKATVVTFTNDAQAAIYHGECVCKEMVLDDADVTIVRADQGSGYDGSVDLHFQGNAGSAVSGTGTLGVNTVGLFNNNNNGVLTIGTALDIQGSVTFKGNKDNNGHAGSWNVVGKTTIANVSEVLRVSSIDDAVTTFKSNVVIAAGASVEFYAAHGAPSGNHAGEIVVDSASTVTLAHSGNSVTKLVLYPYNGGRITANDGQIVPDSTGYYVKKYSQSGNKTVYELHPKRTVVSVTATGVTVEGVETGDRFAPGESFTIEVSGLAEGHDAILRITKHNGGSVVATATNELSYAYTMPDYDIDVSVTAAIQTFAVAWLDWDGAPLETDGSAEYGTVPSYDGAAPSREPTDDTTFWFDGWTNAAVANPTAAAALPRVVADATYGAHYAESNRLYAIDFRAEDGASSYFSTSLTWHAAVVYEGAEPTKPATPALGFAFAGWTNDVVSDPTKVAQLPAVSGDATYFAAFDATNNLYEVVLIADGEPFWRTNIVYGEFVVYPQRDPVHEEDGKTFLFRGWTNEVVTTPVAPVGPVTEAGTWYAAFEGIDAVAKVVYADGYEEYVDTLAGAVARASAGEKAVLLADASGAGFEVDEAITVDLGGHVYEITADDDPIRVTAEGAVVTNGAIVSSVSVALDVAGSATVADLAVTNDWEDCYDGAIYVSGAATLSGVDVLCEYGPALVLEPDAAYEGESRLDGSNVAARAVWAPTLYALGPVSFADSTFVNDDDEFEMPAVWIEEGGSARFKDVEATANTGAAIAASGPVVLDGGSYAATNAPNWNAVVMQTAAATLAATNAAVTGTGAYPALYAITSFDLSGCAVTNLGTGAAIAADGADAVGSIVGTEAVAFDDDALRLDNGAFAAVKDCALWSESGSAIGVYTGAGALVTSSDEDGAFGAYESSADVAVYAEGAGCLVEIEGGRFFAPDGTNPLKALSGAEIEVSGGWFTAEVPEGCLARGYAASPAWPDAAPDRDAPFTVYIYRDIAWADFTVEPVAFVYDGSIREPEVSATFTDDEGGIEHLDAVVDYVLTLPEGRVHAGEYAIAIQGTNSWYGTTNLVFAITNRPLSIVALDARKTYGEADPALLFTTNGLVDGDVLEGVLARADGENVGTYAITQGTLRASADYDLSFTEATFAIDPARVAPPAAPASVVYDGTEKVPGIETSPLWTLSGTNGLVNAGGYDVVVALADALNYTWEDESTTNLAYRFTIVRNTVEKPEAPASASYTGENQTAGIPESDFYTVFVTNELVNAGDYPVRVALDDPANHEWSDGSTNDLAFTFSIGKARVEKPAAPDSATYDGMEKVPAIAASPLYAISGTNGLVNAGDYDIRVSLVAPANYEWSDGTTDDLVLAFAIDKAQVEKPAAPAAVRYDATVHYASIAPSDLYVVSGDTGFVNAGTNAISVALADTANYEWEDGSTDELVFAFAIDKAPLAATARNVTVDFGDDPDTVVYPIDYVGFLGDDDETNALDPAPAVWAPGYTADAERNTSFDLVFTNLGASANYEIACDATDRKLYVAPTPVTLTFDPNGGTDVDLSSMMGLEGVTNAGVNILVANVGTALDPGLFATAREGWVFAGWNPALPAAVPTSGTNYVAQWTEAGAMVISVADGTPTTNYWLSLRDAVEAANGGDTIVLLADDHTSFSLDDLEISIGKALVIDGDGHAVYGVNDYNSYDETTGGEDHDIFVTRNAGDVTIRNLRITEFGGASYVSQQISPLYVSGAYAGTITLENVTIDAFNRHALFIGGGTAVIDGCTIVGDKSGRNVKGAYFQEGVEVYYADVTITNTTISGMGAFDPDWEDSNAAAAVQLTSTGSITVADGSYEGQFAVLVYEGATGTVSLDDGSFEGVLQVDEGSAGSLVVSGGWFDREVPDGYVAEGLLPTTVADANGRYTVKPPRTVSFVAGEGESGLPEALTVAQTDPATEPEQVPAKPGYAFRAWRLGGSDYDWSTPVMEDIELAADWTNAVFKVVVNYVAPAGVDPIPAATNYVSYQSRYTIASPVVPGCEATKKVLQGRLTEPGDLEFTVTYRKGLELVQSIVVGNPVYDGTPRTPELAIADYGTELVAGRDYTFVVDEAVDADEGYHIVLRGIGSWTGSTNLVFAVEPAQIEVPSLKDKVYAAAEQSAEIDGESALYAITAAVDGTDAGEYGATVALDDVRNYRWIGGSADPTNLTWSIVPAPLAITTTDLEVGHGTDPADVVYEYEAVGFVGGETLATLGPDARVASDYVQTADVGDTFEIYLAGVVNAGNYDLAVTTGTLSVVSRTFAVRFVDDDGTEVSSADYEYGTPAADVVVPRGPDKPADAQFVYSFREWTPEIADVTNAAVYTAFYDKTNTVAAVVSWNGLETNYVASLADAFLFAEDDETVVLLADTSEPAAEIGQDNFTLDLNGRTWTVSSGTNEVSGDVRIIDTSATGGGSVEGPFEVTGLLAVGHFVGNAVTVTGDVVASGPEAEVVVAYGSTVDGDVVADSGAWATVYGNVSGDVTATGDDGDGNPSFVSVLSGTVGGDVVAEDGAEIAISGGTLDGTLSAENGGTIEISGGRFAEKPADEFVKDGFVAVPDADAGYYKVVARTPIHLATIVAEDAVYDGRPHTVSLSFEGTGLELDTDYTAAYTNAIPGGTAEGNVNCGRITATVTGIGVWIGTTNVSFSITNRAITLAAASAEKVYDGTPLATNGWTLAEGSLAEGDSFEAVTVEGSRTEIGVSANAVTDVFITNKYGNAVAGNYDITRVDGTLTVVAGRPDWVEITGISLSADGTTVTIEHKVDPAAAYHTIFTCTDLSRQEWVAAESSRPTAQLTVVDGKATVELPASGNVRFFAASTSGRAFASSEPLPAEDEEP